MCGGAFFLLTFILDFSGFEGVLLFKNVNPVPLKYFVDASEDLDEDKKVLFDLEGAANLLVSHQYVEGLFVLALQKR